MSKLTQKQQRFSHAISLLIQYANYHGYGLTFGDAYRDDRCNYGHPKSTHRNRLAIDFNLFKNDNYLNGEEAATGHNLLHDYWDMLGGSARIKKDLNHYSFKHDGVR